MGDNDGIVQRIRALQAELHQVPYMGSDADWTPLSSPQETEKYLRHLLSLKREKNRDSLLWRKIINWD